VPTDDLELPSSKSEQKHYRAETDPGCEEKVRRKGVPADHR